MESNHHGVAPASPSSWCVYQFRHHRKQSTHKYRARLYVQILTAVYLIKMRCFLTQPYSFIKCKDYFCGAGATGAAGTAGTGIAAPFCGAGAVAGACTGAVFPLPDIMEEDDGCPEMYARVNDVNMKITAALVVNLLRKEVPPPAPKTD